MINKKNKSKKYQSVIPFAIGVAVAALLYLTVGWWGFLIIFPWIGFAVSVGTYLNIFLEGKKKLLGRKVSILMIFPCLFIFVPVVNNENFQLEGVALIVMVGYLNKGFIHYLIAKIFGPLIWGRGFCGWACWTGAVLDWLPIRGEKKVLDKKYRKLRYLVLLISITLPAYLVFALNYDVYNNYIYKKELLWMMVGNVVYYMTAIPLAFILKDKRAFCKYLCPVALIMKPGTRIRLVKPKSNKKICIECGKCNACCPMDIDVMGRISKQKSIVDTECIQCMDCRAVCPQNAIS